MWEMSTLLLCDIVCECLCARAEGVFVAGGWALYPSYAHTTLQHLKMTPLNRSTPKKDMQARSRVSHVTVLFLVRSSWHCSSSITSECGHNHHVCCGHHGMPASATHRTYRNELSTIVLESGKSQYLTSNATNQIIGVDYMRLPYTSILYAQT